MFLKVWKMRRMNIWRDRCPSRPEVALREWKNKAGLVPSPRSKSPLGSLKVPSKCFRKRKGTAWPLAEHLELASVCQSSVSDQGEPAKTSETQAPGSASKGLGISQDSKSSKQDFIDVICNSHRRLCLLSRGGNPLLTGSALQSAHLIFRYMEVAGEGMWANHSALGGRQEVWVLISVWNWSLLQSWVEILTQKHPEVWEVDFHTQLINDKRGFELRLAWFQSLTPFSWPDCLSIPEKTTLPVTDLDCPHFGCGKSLHTALTVEDLKLPSAVVAKPTVSNPSEFTVNLGYLLVTALNGMF